jgi:hypothetical protein
MSSKTIFHVAIITCAAFFSNLPTSCWSQSYLELWKEQALERINCADFESFQHRFPNWYDSNALPKLKDTVPQLDALEEALQPWGQDPKLEDACVQSLLQGNMLRLQILNAMYGLYGDDIARGLALKELPSSYQWIPVLASTYNHAFNGSDERAGLWGLTLAQAEKEGIAHSTHVDERMLPQESTRAAMDILDRLQRRFPMSPERVLVGFIKGMPFASRWSGKPGYDKELDEWLSFYRVVSRFMVNLDSPEFEASWGEELTQWETILCPGEISREALKGVLDMPEHVQKQLLPWWIHETLPCAIFEEFQPLLPNMWAEIWAQHLDDLANWDASALSEAATKETTNSKNPVERRSLSIPCVEHEVRKGDTLYNISKRFEGTTPEQIAETNGIDTVIKIGQILCIPQTE